MKTQTPKEHITLLPHEVLEKIQKAKSEPTRLKALQANDSFALKTILQVNFREDLIFQLPEGPPPYTPDEGVAGEQLSPINKAIRQLQHCVSTSKVPQWKKEQLFIRLLETVHAEDAKVLIAMKDKKLTEVYPNLTKKLVQKAYPTLNLGT